MSIMALGQSLDGTPLFEERSEVAAATALARGLAGEVGPLRALARTADEHGLRAEQRRPVRDLNDPVTAGWTYLVRDGDPSCEAWSEIVAPLAALRGMPAPLAPLRYRGEGPSAWADWLTREYFGRGIGRHPPPAYVLILGGPDQVPFEFQSLLQVVARVGRLHFDDLDGYQAYVTKLLRLARAQAPSVEREAVLFGPDAGPRDPTHYSRRWMVEPLARHLHDTQRFRVTRLLGDKATKPALMTALATRRPALVYLASHGISAVDAPVAEQRTWNGAICCARRSDRFVDDVVSARDIDLGAPLLDGAVVFQFACHGYGTPATSTYAHWLGREPGPGPGAEFVSALPRRLLAHPRGPIAYLGHVDLAFMHAFTDGGPSEGGARWQARMAPFVAAVDHLVTLDPVGRALEDMARRYGGFNAMITQMYDDLQANQPSLSPMKNERLVENWILRGDARNYMLLGDPAAGLRLPGAT